MGGSKKTTTSSQNSTATTQLPAWMTGAGQSLYGDAAAWNKANPVTAYTGEMTAPTSQNQQMGSSLARAAVGTGQSDLDAARGYTAAAAGAQPYFISATDPTAAGMTAAQQGAVGTTAARQGVATATPAQQQGVARTRAVTQGAATGTAAQQGWTGYNADQVGSGLIPQVTADHVTTDMWSPEAATRYMNPYVANVTNNTLSTMRLQDAADHSALNDQVAASGAFGGTRGALMETEQQKNQALTRQNYTDQSYKDAYDNAQGMFTSDEGRKLSADQGNQSADLSASTTNAGNEWQRLLANMTAANSASQFDASAANTASGANADRSQSMGVANMDAINQMLGLNAGRQQAANDTNAGAENTMRGANADRAQQVSLANQGAANTALGANADREQQSGTFNATAINNALGLNADREQATGVFNATAANDMATGNANRDLTASTANQNEWNNVLQRIMAAGGQSAQIGQAANDLSGQDIARLEATGGVDQATANDADQAAYQDYLRTQTQPMDNFNTLMSILSGTPKNVTTTGTQNGTSTTKSSSSLFSQLLAAGQLAAQFA